MDKLKRLFTSCGNFLFPKRCALCGEILSFYENADLCSKCLESYRVCLDKPCPVCREKCSECHCSDKKFKSLSLTHYTALGFYRRYDDPVGTLIYRLKREYDRDLQKFFAKSLAETLLCEFGSRSGDFCITFPPRGKDAVRKYGFDQSECISRRVAEYMGCPWERIFVRVGGGVQKKLDTGGRMKNASEMFALADGVDVHGRRFIVIDDVMTTGATLGALASLLYSEGAEIVYPAALFITEPKVAKPKDEGLWFEEQWFYACD